jgi:hypothetical protein
MMGEIGLEMLVEIVALGGDGILALVGKLELDEELIGGWNMLVSKFVSVGVRDALVGMLVEFINV